MTDTIIEQEVVAPKVAEKNIFEDSEWSEVAPIKEAKKENNVEPQPKEELPVEKQVEIPKEETPSVDYNKYVKDKFGFDNEEIAISEIAKLKEKTGTKFANEASEKFYKLLKEGKEDEVLSFLSEKKKLDKLSSATIDNIDIASEIVKLGMQYKYQGLSPEEIDFKFKRMYGVPAMPQQKEDELDDEYEVRLNEWKEKKEIAESELVIEAKLTKPEIQKLKSELKLPDIQAANENVATDQEELDRLAKIDAEFAQKVPETVKSFNGVSVAATAKYGDVELPIEVKYIPNNAEKAVIEAGLKDGQYLAKRWFDEQGVPSATKIADDIFFLENKQAILQKVATEAAAQAFEQYQKNRSNLKLNGEQQRTFVPVNKAEALKKEESFWDES